MTPPVDPSPELIFDTLVAYQSAAALRTAIELELFTAVAAGATTVEALAERCRAAPRGVRSLADYLVVHGFLRKSGDRYALPPGSALHLDRRSSAYMGGAVAFLGSGELRCAFDRLTDAVRQGGTAIDGGGTTSIDNPVWVEFARAMEPMSRPLAALVAERVAERALATGRVLDVAAGHGRYGITIAERFPSAHIDALDWPSVLQVAQENADLAALAGRYHLRPGSAFDIEWGEGYDLILMINFLHHFDPPTCSELLARARGALGVGGHLVALEAVPNPDRVSPDRPAAFSLVMLATTPGGDAYTEEEYRGIFAEAGFASLEVESLEAPGHPRLLVAS